MTSTQLPERVSVTSNPSFGELFLASLVLIRHQGALMLIHAVFPLAGVLVLVTPFLVGRGPGPVEIGVAVLGFAFTPLVTALAVWQARRRNKLAQGPFTYSFDAEGMGTSSPAFDQTIRWAAIPRVCRAGRFLFVFMSPSRAHCIPTRFFEPGDLEQVLAIAKAHTRCG